MEIKFAKLPQGIYSIETEDKEAVVINSNSSYEDIKEIIKLYQDADEELIS